MKDIESKLETLRSQAQKLVEKIAKLEGNTSNPNMQVKRKLKSNLNDLEAEHEEVSTRGFYVCCEYLTPQSFFNLQNQFLNWALPRAQTVFSKLAQHVNPDTYNKVLKMQMEKEERNDEGSVDQRIRTTEV